MKNTHPFYGLLYIILLPVTLLLGMCVLFCLIIAFSNPALLLPLFLLACFVVYTIASFIFYLKAIRQQQTCKTGLRDLIRINAFIIIIPALFMILQGIMIASNTTIIRTAITQIKNMQQPMPNMSEAMLTTLLVRMYYFLVVYATAIVIHVIYTFRLLRQYKAFFCSQHQLIHHFYTFCFI